MSGISAYGVKIPRRRVCADSIHAVWKAPSMEIIEKLGMKERTVTGTDEDAITLGSDAAFACLRMAKIDVKEIDGLVFASGSNPYDAKASATVLQDVIGLNHDIFATDVQFAGRSGFDAIKIAKCLVDSKQCKNVLVVASDTLNVFMSPGHVYDYAAAAGGVALLISNENVIAEIQDLSFASEDRANWYRLSGDRYTSLGCGFVGYISNWGLMDSVKEAWKKFKAKNGVDANSYEHFALPQGTVVQTFMSSSAIGCDVYSAIPYCLSEMTGDMGCAGVLASMCSIFDLVDDADQHILAVGYGWGDGSSVMGLTTTERIGQIEGKPFVMPQLDDKIMVEYAKVLKYEKKLDRNLKGLSSFY